MRFLYKEKPSISFVSTIDGLTSVDECLPKNASAFIPFWWKNLVRETAHNSISNATSSNIKSCVSFPSYFSMGYILPMWCDTILRFDTSTNSFMWKTSDSRFTWDIQKVEGFHTQSQPSFLGSVPKVICRTEAPWKMVTTDGYAVQQLPLLYHFDNRFSVLPGVIETDTFYNTTIQLLIHEADTDIFIPRGTPLAQYIPFKKEKLKLNVRTPTKKDLNKFLHVDATYFTKFIDSKQFLHLKKEKENKNE